MVSIIGVQFQKNGKLYYFDANGFETKVGDYVIVDTVRGFDLGEIVTGARNIEDENCPPALKKMIRIATEQDIQHSRDNRSREKEAFSICQKKIAEHKLEMKLVSVEYAFDNSKILFFFTANGRVDFRSLVKDLASVFKMRIELRQIGVRDEAKMLGGLGPCGRPICCGTFLEQFQPVSIKMAKEQNLSLNPTKISGVCGRLMCCLKYEQDHYEQTRKRMPRVGKEVQTPDGSGPVTELNIVKETVFVRLVNGDTSEIKEYPLDSITKHPEGSLPDGKTEKQPENTVSPSETSGSAAQPKKTPAAGSQGPEVSPAAGSSKGREKNKAKQNPVLGQPVKRENPKRALAKGEPDKNSQARRQPQNTQDSRKEKPDSRPASPSPWADAVQKAMLAMDQHDN